METKKVMSKKQIIGGAIATAVVVVLVLVLLANRDAPEKRVARLLDLGNQYLLDLDYEQAIASYDEVLSIEPKNADAYLGLFEAYVRQNDFEAAFDIATKGYELTGDERLKEKIDMINSGQIFDSTGRSLKMSYYDESGTLQWWHEYTYNRNGDTASVTHKSATGSVLGHIDCEYDTEGNPLVDYAYQTMEGNLIRVESEYENGRKIRETHYEDNGNKVVEEYEYSADNKIHKVNITDVNDGIEHKRYEIFSYEGEHRVRRDEYENYDGMDVLRGYFTYKFDADGNQIEEACYSVGYDGEGDYLDFRTVSEYDAEGNLLRSTRYDGEGNVIGTYDNE